MIAMLLLVLANIIEAAIEEYDIWVQCIDSHLGIQINGVACCSFGGRLRR